MTNKPDIEGMKKRVAAATPGPGYKPKGRLVVKNEKGGDNNLRTNAPGWNANVKARFTSYCAKEIDQVYLDLEFATHARTDLPVLIAAYEERGRCIEELADKLKILAASVSVEEDEAIGNLLDKWGLE